MKHRLYRETMLVLVDGNNRNIILAIGLCVGEDENNCGWFIDQSKRSRVNFQGIPVFPDRGRALLPAIERRAPEAISRFCTTHIVSDIKHNFAEKYPPDIEAFVYKLQAATTKAKFKSDVFTLSMPHPDIADYVSSIPAERWAMYPGSI
ncbi:hypothetical protein PINS_up017251 [Pythium insidiosum]|nr:hypothetical protein PINS_up017251 [Pythium insidiosum]